MDNRALQMMQKYLGLVITMRKHQEAFFKHRMDFDKKKSIEYEKKVDEYSKILQKAGLSPTFEETTQKISFLNGIPDFIQQWNCELQSAGLFNCTSVRAHHGEGEGVPCSYYKNQIKK
jgi:hypothetical protein